MNEGRLLKFREVVRARQPNLTVILENVHDVMNIGAVLRSCDSVGICEVYVLYSDPQLHQDKIKLGKRSSAGARQWVDVHYFTDLEACFQSVRQKYTTILSTKIAPGARSVYELDLTQSMALLFGNEKSGVSKEAHAKADGHFLIPQVGMVQSLNISVACAVTLYEAFRQRKAKGFYDENPLMSEADQAEMLEVYRLRSYRGIARTVTEKKN